ncbi:MAG: prephenate dehydratase domain-containing protein [Polyangiaceae bacterium]
MPTFRPNSRASVDGSVSNSTIPNASNRSWRGIERLIATKQSRFDSAAAVNLFKEIQSICAVLDAPLRVGYLGPPGTFSHLAARSAFGLGPTYVDFSAIPAIFSAVERGQNRFRHGPLREFDGGRSHLHPRLFLVERREDPREFLLDVTVCLIGHPIDYAKVERVYSHPQPLAQCRGWLAQHLPHAQLLSMPSTTAAAKEAAKDSAGVALASHLAAEIHGLDVLAESIQIWP